MNFFKKIIHRTPTFPIKATFDESLFKESIYISSSNLYYEHDKLIKNEIGNSKDIQKLNLTIKKYEIRSSTRATPFGLFAGLGTGVWGDSNKIIFDSDVRETLVRKSRIDMNVLCALSQEILNKNYVRPYLKFYPNNSLYLIGDCYRYIEYHYFNNRRIHKINKVDYADYLESIFLYCDNGATIGEIVNLLVSDDVTIQEATAFVDELINSQLLISQIEPSITGGDYFTDLLNQLESIYLTNKDSKLFNLLEVLKQVNKSLDIIDENIVNPIDLYKDIKNKINFLLPDVTESNFIQVDLYKKGLDTQIDVKIQEQILSCIRFLDKITPVYENQTFEEFKKRFQARYEEQEVSLMHVLDAESGIGYPIKDTTGINPLINDIYNAQNETSISIKWDLLQSILLDKLFNSIKNNDAVITLRDEDFLKLNFQKGVLPQTVPIMFSVIDANTNKILIKHIGGASSTYIISRFAMGNSELNDIVTDLAKFEQEQCPNQIIAEIVHLPESRTGNILARPSFRAYEIPYLAKSNVDKEFQIRMEDLYLKLVNGKLVLFDKRIKKEILPRLGNAHNFRLSNLPVYLFLCDLQLQYTTKPKLGFNWGSLITNQFLYLPRIEYGNCVLSPARWQLNELELAPLKDSKKTIKERHESFLSLKERIKLPSKFLIADGDNELLIDVESNSSIELFIDSVKNRINIVLEEFLFVDDYPLVKDNNGNYFTHECIAILLNSNKDLESNNVNFNKEFLSKQTFFIGSEWLYYKIYCGPKTADTIISEVFIRICKKLLEHKIIDKWFFIRYADPDTHLRFRLHISDFTKYGEVVKLINTEFEPLLNSHLVSKIQTDTYKRELERYGDNTIEMVEQLFCNDSIFVGEMLSMLDSDTGGDIRWQIAIRSVDELLSDFYFDDEMKFKLIEKLSMSFFNEHGGRKDLKIVLDGKFRKLRSKVEEVLSRNNENEKDYFSIIEALERRSYRNSSVIDKIIEIRNDNKLEIPLDNLIASLLHMNLDRLFMGRNRTNEFAVYDLLVRYYKSTLARNKKIELTRNA